ncbi:hypothetical protein BG006_002020 [Podila minutissima]|uniref:Uncharacterized protein n=1 Tax=Podila minutissima TaxID=64525 RepID=A0A9P5SSQ2_9FUNG|nr:hypothetical protein BG006_002020 [Podila minutissima]
MVKSTFALLAVSAIASVALAQVAIDPIEFGAPVASTVWTAGTSATVAWNNDCSDLGTNLTFPITLNEQINGLQQPVGGGPIGTLDCSKKGSTTVQVPNVPTGEFYSVLVSPGGVLSYSALFKIVGAAANTTSAAPIASATATPTGKSTASGSKTLPTVSQTPTKTPDSAAGALKAGSTAALVVLAGVASMML